MNIIPDTELIITDNSKIYHLNLSKEQIGDNIILVGDPERVSLVSMNFDSIEYKVNNREFITHTGTLNNKKISVISTGIGTDNIDIVMNELDALVNINFKTRKIREKKKSLNIIRIGTSGAIHPETKIDTFIASSYALGLDNLAYFYKKQDIIEQDMVEKYIKDTCWPQEIGKPYFIKVNQKLLDKFSDLDNGITATAPGFYAAQGRKLRLTPSINNLNEKMRNFNYKGLKIKNFEMETSALYYLSKNLGHNSLTICAIIGNRNTNEYSKNYKKTIKKLIKLTLNRMLE
tara:strand:- start:285 stop:1151 length:867 start_codon:yes stop_codon:yes gene_type:complete